PFAISVGCFETLASWTTRGSYMDVFMRFQNNWPNGGRIAKCILSSPEKYISNGTVPSQLNPKRTDKPHSLFHPGRDSRAHQETFSPGFVRSLVLAYRPTPGPTPSHGCGSETLKCSNVRPPWSKSCRAHRGALETQ